MRDDNEQPSNDGGHQADVSASGHGTSDGADLGVPPSSVDGEEPATLLADYELAIASTAVDTLCRVLVRHPTASAADLRELLKAHPTLGGVTLAELFFGAGAEVK